VKCAHIGSQLSLGDSQSLLANVEIQDALARLDKLTYQESLTQPLACDGKAGKILNSLSFAARYLCLVSGVHA
jgi:hypothetical protein